MLPVVARRGADHRSLSRSRGRRRRCPTAPCSTARCSPFAAIGRCRSRRCSSASAASDRWRGRRATCRSCSWPTTSSRTTASTSGELPLREPSRALVGDRRRARSSVRPAAAEPRAAPLLPFDVTTSTRRRRPRATLRVSPHRRGELGGAGAPARRLARPRRRRADARSASTRRTASAASAATGGSGRSIRTPSTRC